MVDKDLSEYIKNVSSDFMFIEPDSPVEELKGFLKKLQNITNFAEEKNSFIIGDCSSMIASIIEKICNKEISNTDTAFENISSLLTAMQSIAEDTSGQIASKFKETLAVARVYLADLSGEENSTVIESSSDMSEEEEFLQMMEQRIDTVESTLLSMDEGKVDFESMRGVFREFHTLKGETGMLGMKDLHEFFHSAESSMERLRNEAPQFTHRLAAAIMEINDISRMLLKREATVSDFPERISSALSESTAAVEDAFASTNESSSENEKVEVDTPNNEINNDDFFAGMAEEAAEIASEAEEESIDKFEEAESRDKFSELDKENLIEEFEDDDLQKHQNTEEYKKKTKTQQISIPQNGSSSKGSLAQTGGVIPVDVRRIDALLELVANTMAATSQICQNPVINSLSDHDLREDVLELQRSVTSLHTISMDLRMVPIRSLFQRMKRLAFDVSRASQKKVDVILQGEQTEIDRTVMDNLTAAMTHMVRNAIDHGIESPDERRMKDKPEKGKLKMKAYRRGSDIAIEISDDGGGIDRENVKKKAIEAGILSENDLYDDSQLIDFIFRSGISTAKKLTGVSGRGVGMEAVSQAIKDLHGKIEVKTGKEEGTVIRLILPLSLASIDGLMVKVGYSFYIIPALSVRECLRPKKEDITQVEGRGTVLQTRGAIVPIIHVGKMLKVDYEIDDYTNGDIIIVEHQGKIGALFVDKVINTRQVMVKPLNDSFKGIDLVSGTAELGARKVALVLALNNILSRVSAENSGSFGTDSAKKDKIETVDIGSNQVGMVDFYIDHLDGNKVKRSRFAINAFKAREFVNVQHLTELPNSPKGFSGMLLLRKQTIPVVDLAELVGFKHASDERIIVICEFGLKTVGIIVTGVNRINYISWSEIKEPPSTSMTIDSSYIVGTILMKGTIVFVLDFEHIVQEVITMYKDFGDSLQGVQKRGSRNKILLIEDSMLIRRKTAKALTDAGMEVTQASNGKEAFEIINDTLRIAEEEGKSIFEYIDLVVSDIEMPQMDGYTFTRELKGNPKTMILPVILFSSLTNDTVVNRAREVHADGVVSKSETPELARHLSKYL
jgi:two-component system chemotaxis sensor kinase CheA